MTIEELLARAPLVRVAHECCRNIRDWYGSEAALKAAMESDDPVVGDWDSCVHHGFVDALKANDWLEEGDEVDPREILGEAWGSIQTAVSWMCWACDYRMESMAEIA